MKAGKGLLDSEALGVHGEIDVDVFLPSIAQRPGGSIGTLCFTSASANPSASGLAIRGERRRMTRGTGS